MVSLFEGSPAYQKGLRRGDVIARILGQDTKGWTSDQAVRQLRGPKGTPVAIAIKRAGYDNLIDLDVTRDEIQIPTVPAAFMLDQTTGYVRVSEFGEQTDAELGRALRELSRQGMQRLVFDLRNNPGGVLEAAVAVADALLDTGNIVSAEGRAPDARFRMDAKPGQSLPGVDLVVLVNGASASAAEILAGAIKDNHRGRLVGRKTFGKGLVQSVIPLADGRALKLTTSRYATPSGAMINERGIEPDVTLKGRESVPGEPARDPEVKAALREFAHATRSQKTRA